MPFPFNFDTVAEHGSEGLGPERSRSVGKNMEVSQERKGVVGIDVDEIEQCSEDRCLEGF